LNFPGNFISNLSANARSNRPPLLLDHAIPYQPDDLCQPPLHNHGIPYLPTSWPVPTNTDYNLYLRSCIEAPWYTFPVPKKHTHIHTHTHIYTHPSTWIRALAMDYSHCSINSRMNTGIYDRWSKKYYWFSLSLCLQVIMFTHRKNMTKQLNVIIN
jgi:hypothetical protein